MVSLQAFQYQIAEYEWEEIAYETPSAALTTGLFEIHDEVVGLHQESFHVP